MTKFKLTPAQQEVYRALQTTGPQPDVVTVPVVQHLSPIKLSSSGIRTRRRELEDAGLVKAAGVKIINGRKHTVWGAV
jgi:hypothetical protein